MKKLNKKFLVALLGMSTNVVTLKAGDDTNKSGVFAESDSDEQDNGEINEKNEGLSKWLFLKAIKASPFKIGLDFTVLSFVDFQKYGGKSSFNIAKIDLEKDPKNPKQLGSFMSSELSLSSEINLILPTTLYFSVTNRFGESKIDLGLYYLKNKWLTIGKAPGNFCTYKPDSLRYSTHLLMFSHEVNKMFSYSFAMEEAKFSTKADDDAKFTENKKIEHSFGTEKYLILTDKEDADASKKLYSSPTFLSKVAFTGSATLSLEDVTLKLSGLYGAPSYFYGDMKKHEDATHVRRTMGGAALSVDWTIIKKEGYNKNKKLTFSSHLKFREGASGYNPEAGGFPLKSYENGDKLTLDDKGNFLYYDIKKGDESSPDLIAVRSLGGSIASKYFYNPCLYSALSAEMLYILNGDKVADVEDENKIHDTIVVKVAPIGFCLSTNLNMELSYKLAAGNILNMKQTKRKLLNRFELSISVNV